MAKAKSKKLRVGIVGCGGIGTAMHVPGWKVLVDEGRVEVVGLCDLILERADKCAAQYENAPPTYTNFRQMLKECDCDIVDVCVHNRNHKLVAAGALEKGAHVLVEKPMAMNVRECEQMIAAAKKSGVKLMVAQHMRFEPMHEKLKDVVESGRLGQVYHANTTWLRRRGIPGWGKFHIKKESAGGPLIDIGVHMMDLAIWLMGSPRPVAASGKVHRMFGDRSDLVNCDFGQGYPPGEFDVEDFASAYVRFDNGSTLACEVSWAANVARERHGLYILGDKAGIGTDPPGVFGYEKNALTSTTFDWLPTQRGHFEEIRHFLGCVEEDKPVRVRPEESLNIQKILDAVYRSSRTNREAAIK